MAITAIFLLGAFCCHGQDIGIERWPSMKEKRSRWGPEVRRCANGKMGIVGMNNVHQCNYDTIRDFTYDGVAVVDSNGKKGVLNSAGRTILPCEFDAISIGDRFDYVRRADKIGCIRWDGKWILPLVYQSISPDYYGLYDFFVLSGNGGYGVADRHGRVIIPSIYKRVRTQGSERLLYFALIDSSRKVGIADTNGVILFPFRYRNVFLVNYCTAVAQVDSTWFVLSSNGEDRAIGKFDRLTLLDLGGSELLEFENGRKRGLLDLSGRVIVPAGFVKTLGDYTLDYTAKYRCLLVRDSSGCEGVLSSKGKQLVPMQYKNVVLREGKFWCSGTDSSAIYDTMGRHILSVPYSNIQPLQELRYLVGREGALGMVNDRGGLLLDTLHKRIENLGGGFLRLTVKGGSEAVVDSNGRVVIGPGYKTINAYDNGFFHVTDSQGRLIVVDENNREIVTQLVHYDNRFENGLLRLNTRAMIYATKDGSVVRARVQRRMYREVGDFRSGRAWVVDSAGFCGYVNKQGQEVIPCVFLDGGIFRQGIAPVYYYGAIANNYPNSYSKKSHESAGGFSGAEKENAAFAKCGFIDTMGMVKVPFVYSDIARLGNNLISVAIERRWGVIRPDNSLVVSFRYDDPLYFDAGLAVAKKDGQYSIVDTTDKIVTRLFDSCEYDGLDDYGTALVVDGQRKAGKISRKGDLVIPPKFELVSSAFGDSLFAFSINDSVDYIRKIGFLRIDGTVLVPPIYYSFEASTISSYLVVSTDSGYGILDKKLRTIVPCRYDKIDADIYNQGLFATMKDDRWGYINTKGLWVVMPKYDEARPFSEGLAAVKKDDVWMYIDKKGMEVLRFE